MNIYIAGSLFSESEIAQRLLEERSIKEEFGDKVSIYNPITAPFNEDKQTLPTPIQIYDGDFEQLDWADVVLVDLGCMHDQGVMLELGIVAAHNEFLPDNKKKRIIAVLSDIRLPSSNLYKIPTFGMNHMVLGAIEKHGVIVESFEHALYEIKKELNKNE